MARRSVRPPGRVARLTLDCATPKPSAADRSSGAPWPVPGGGVGPGVMLGGMKFILFHDGALKAAGNGNKRKDHKHEIRRRFHGQLKELWKQVPLDGMSDLLSDPVDPSLPIAEREAAGEGVRDASSVIQARGGFRLAPLVCSKLRLVAEISVTLLRPELPGRIVTQAGDIDNRLKTLLDALKMPSEPTELPAGASPGPDEDPFFCLSEDDNLITRLDVRTDRLPKDRRLLLGIARQISPAASQKATHVEGGGA